MDLRERLKKAIYADDANAVIAAIEAGASLDYHYLFVGDPLKLAIENECTKAAIALIWKGANVTQNGNDEDSIFVLAREPKFFSVFKAAIETGRCSIFHSYHDHYTSSASGVSYEDHYTLMGEAIEGENSAAIELLIVNGYKCNDEIILQLTEKGLYSTALLAVRKILETGGNISTNLLVTAIETKEPTYYMAVLGMAPHLAKEYDVLDAAVSNDQIGLIKKLRELGADPNQIGWLRQRFLSKEIIVALFG